MSSDMDLELQDLQQYFAGRLPERLQEIEDAWARVRESSWQAGTLRELHRLTHSLTGAGSTFGFPEVTRTARALERFLQTLLERSGIESDEVALRVEVLLADLRRAAQFPPFPPPRSVLSPREAVTARAADRLVFLAEDDADLAVGLASQLQHYGYRVHLLDSLPGLNVEADLQHPDVLIMDVMFPEGGLAGIQAVAELRRSYTGPWPKVIFLSARGDMEARLAAVRAGGDAYLTKPLDLGSLVEKLDTLTERHARSPYRVLLVEDDPDFAGDLGGVLEAAGMHAEVVFDSLQIMEPLYSFQPDLILMDSYVKGCTGPELAAVLRQQDSYLSTPIVFLSSEQALTEQLAAIERGGDDFLPKSIDPQHLVAAVEARARRGRVLQSLISHDGLTGLLNHSNLKLNLESEIARASRDGSHVSYAMVDLDHFKAINDHFGHSTGDRLLRSLALFLRQRLRRSDILGRYGGDELAVILPRTASTVAGRVLDEIRENFSQLRHRSGNRDFTATLSCGVASYPARPRPDLLVEAADAALYTAKRSGRNRVELAG